MSICVNLWFHTSSIFVLFRVCSRLILLRVNRIAHSAINNIADEIVGEKTVRENRLDGACVVQTLQMLVRQIQIQARQIVLKLA